MDSKGNVLDAVGECMTNSLECMLDCSYKQ